MANTGKKVVQMIQQFWVCDDRKITVCVDSYDGGILKGRFYHDWQGSVAFESLSQFLLRMENLLEELQLPQSYTAHRKFSVFLRNYRKRGVRQSRRHKSCSIFSDKTALQTVLNDYPRLHRVEPYTD